MKKFTVLVSIVLIIFGLVGCNTTQKTNSTQGSTPSPQQNTSAAKTTLTVAAASDLTKAFAEIGAAFEKANNCTVTFSFGSTGTLSEQIANGGPFDVFASADESVIDDLDKKGFLVSDTKQLYALGRIGIATSKNSKIQAITMEDLLKPEIKKIAIANPEHAPYGLAAKQALETAGLWDQLQSKMVYGKNISETLTFITTGNADAGFIALSLKDDKTLNFNLIDQKMHQPLKQAMAVIKNTKQEDLARKFVQYVNSNEGKTIMSKYGFVVPEK
ncbi:molybdate ABC transporter substrate-binding protein [Desulfitobacterium sp. AusDCA]|uniref:molybdate ABC transporter substrate-binding protein n=1 Tax=Desulfitobacterium sp. AusDCA TaxID=3240383 RepID=UPI003DA6EDBE